MSSDKVYMNNYMKKRWKVRRSAAVQFLGGRCSCGSVENLEFDHVDPTTKTANVSKLSSASELRFWEEVRKCQLLCKRCHTLKTRNDATPEERKNRARKGWEASAALPHSLLSARIHRGWETRRKKKLGL